MNVGERYGAAQQGIIQKKNCLKRLTENSRVPEKLMYFLKSFFNVNLKSSPRLCQTLCGISSSEARSKIGAGQTQKWMCAESYGFLFLPFTMVRTQEKEIKRHEINARV